MQVLVNDANASINGANNQNTNRRDFYGRVLDRVFTKRKEPVPQIP